MSNKLLSTLWKFRIRVLLLALVLLLIGGCLAVFGYIWLRGYRQLERLQAALAAAEGPDRAHARKLLQRSLSDDRNNENVIVKLAEIQEADGFWTHAALLWQRAASLNEFKPAFRERADRALLISRNLQELKRQLANRNKVTPVSRLYGAFGSWLAGDSETAAQQLDTLDGDPAGSLPLAQLLRVLLTSTEGGQELETWTASTDPQSAFEARFALGNLELLAEQPERAEYWYLQAAAFNPEVIYPLLGNFYFLRSDYDKAIPAYRQALEYGPSPVLAMRLGELLSIRGEIDELKELSNRYRRGSKDFLAAGYYLDALLAYCAADNAVLAQNLKPLQGTLESPVFLMLSLHSAIANDQSDEIQRLLPLLMAKPEYRALLPEARSQAQNYIATVLIPAGRAADAAAIAALIADPGNPDLNLTRLLLLNKSASNALTSPEVAAALRAFPDDPVILEVATNFSLRTGQYEAALRLAEKGLQSGADPLAMYLLLFRAQQGRGDIDAATRVMAQLTEQWPLEPTVIYYRIGSAVQISASGQLEALQQELAADPTPFHQRASALAAVELARLQQDQAAIAATLKALGQAEIQYEASLPADWPQTRPWEINYAFRSALMLAEGDEIAPAIAIYRRILDHVANRGLVLLNLSELYAAQGSHTEALECAKEVWRATPDWSAAQECYGLRLAESGQDEVAQELLQPLLRQTASGRVKPVWEQVAEREIARLYQAGTLERCQELCNVLLENGDPRGVAQDYLNRIAAAAEKE